MMSISLGFVFARLLYVTVRTYDACMGIRGLVLYLMHSFYQLFRVDDLELSLHNVERASRFPSVPVCFGVVLCTISLQCACLRVETADLQ